MNGFFSKLLIASILLAIPSAFGDATYKVKTVTYKSLSYSNK